jgi:hypothetical protein
MTSRKALVDVLLATGLPDHEATTLAALQPVNGSTWTSEVLNTGKVDELKFAAELARLFKSGFENIETTRIDRDVLGALPSRFVFKHQILPLANTETTARLAMASAFSSSKRSGKP